MRRCDPSRAKAAITPYLKSKDKSIADEAKRELKSLDEELARNK